MAEHRSRGTELEPVREEPVTEDQSVAATSTPTGEMEEARISELTADLQRIGAEYANYRKRAERDRQAAAEQACAQVITELLPALDTVHRAEQHDQLTGPLRAVADSLDAALSSARARPVGHVGDRFDPTVHDAVEHHYSTTVEITEPTVVEVHRPGYRVGDRVLRPALVAVTEPDPELVDAISADAADVGETRASGDADCD
jgi:molecular chaperone GrpE